MSNRFKSLNNAENVGTQKQMKTANTGANIRCIASFPD